MKFSQGRNLLLSSVGFEHLLDTFSKLESNGLDAKPQSYPPYNIVKKNEINYSIEIAVAGFSSEEIDIFCEDTKLQVNGNVKKTTEGEFIYRGIATRNFTHEFTLAESVIVKSANIFDGLLIIDLENIIPDEKKPRKIVIGEKVSKLSDRRKVA